MICIGIKKIMLLAEIPTDLQIYEFDALNSNYHCYS